MDIELRCSDAFIKELKSDFENLQSKISIPINARPVLGDVKKQEPSVPAATFSNFPEQTWCEFNEKYFAECEEDRLLILLHELIHAKHLASLLSQWHRTKRDYVINLHQKVQRNLQSAPLEQLNRLNFWSKFLPFVFNWLYEIWAELYMREEYPEIFPKRMELEYRNVERQFSDNKQRYRGAYAKYQIFWEMLRPAYFLKIAKEESEIGQRFTLILEQWKEKLRVVVRVHEMEEFERRADDLTDSSAYPDPSELEKNYLSFADSMIAELGTKLS